MILVINLLLGHLSSGVLPALSWKCWLRSLRGPNTRRWQPFLRLPPSLPSPRSLRACPTHAGTSCGRCLWRRSGVPLLTFCSAIHSSRAASESSWHHPRAPSPAVCEASCGPRHLPCSPARYAARTPPPAPQVSSRAQHHSTSCPATYHQCLPCQDHSPSSSTQNCHREARLIASAFQSPPRHRSVVEMTRKHLAVSQATGRSSQTRAGKVTQVREQRRLKAFWVLTVAEQCLS